MFIRHLHLACCAILLLQGIPGHAADDTDAPPDAQEIKVKAWVSSWSWNQGLHYGIDGPDFEETWKTGSLQWRELLRGDLGLRVAIDAAGMHQGGRFIPLEKNVAVRRAYVYANGSIVGLWKPVSFKFELGEVDDRFSLRDASIAFHEIPYAGTFRLGAFDAPMSLSMLTSSRATPLMERGLVVDAMAPGSLAGLQLSNRLAPQRVTWAFGFFSEGDDADTGDSSRAPARFVGRATWLPWQTAEEFLQVGLSGSWAFSPSERMRFRSRPECFLAPYVVDTGDIPAQQSVLVDLEGVWVRDRLSVQGEYLNGTVLHDASGSANLGGFYLMTSYFLTPDRRAYNEDEAAFGALVPSHPLSWRERQVGAFEVAFRWSYIDLTDRDVRGGRASILMSGLNWYWNRYVRLQFNAGWSHASGGPRPGDAAILETRFDLMI